MITKVQNFITEVMAELRKVSWLTRKDLIDSTKIVIISVFLLGIYISIIDLCLAKALTLVIR